MENTLENEMLDAAISWCDSNGINVLEPEQLSNLVNSLYVTVCDAALDTAQPVQVNAMLVEALEKTLQRALKWFESIDKTACEREDSINKSRKLFAVARDARIAMSDIEAALAAAQQAQPVCGYDDETGNCTRVNCCKQAQPALRAADHWFAEWELVIPEDARKAFKETVQPAQPKREPLSLQEIADAWGLKPENIPASDIEAVREIEAAHGIKQGGQHD